MRIPTLADVYAARLVINKYLKRTPLVYAKRLSEELGCDAYLKLENLQPVGSFKIRGGINYVYRMREEAERRGLVTASTGNHAQSIAYSGALFGIDTTIVMPNGVSQVKVDAVKSLGARVVMQGDYFEEAFQYATKLANDKGHLLVHAINEPLLYEGVGTMHLEVFEALPSIDIEIHPIGGGSGAATACIVYKRLKPSVSVVGVQAEGAQAFYQSWKTGRLVSTGGVKTKAEGLAASMAYELPLSIMRGKLDDLILVSDDDMARAIQALLFTSGQVAEHAGAAATAAAFKIRDRLKGKKVVLPITGRNIQPELLVEIIKSGFV
ncbi:MAG: threonine/serine dehydratase [Candidatus Verstraetearchaeota archaeon]|nr:threonine/serine dehydratase [Candidatus Verstraetearchaeota archaeon]